MKKLYVISALLLSVLSLSAQTVKVWSGDKSITTVKPDSLTFDGTPNVYAWTLGEADIFAQPDSLTFTSGTYPTSHGTNFFSSTTGSSLAGGLYRVLKLADYTRAENLNSVEITDEHLAEIKEFTDANITAASTTNKARVQQILSWVKKNIAYDWDDNDAYSVFKNRKGVCQGYSNLTVAMLHTQAIPSVIANGYLGSYGAHAWVYVYIMEADESEGKWYVIDPTNDGSTLNLASAYTSYGPNLIPWQLDMPLLEDENGIYEYRNKGMNIKSLKCNTKAIVLPSYISAGTSMVRINSFDPQEAFSENIREIYIPRYITSVGDYHEGLDQYGTHLRAIHVDPGNTKLSDYEGALYNKKHTELIYIPGGMTELTVAPMKTVEKNTIYLKPNLQKVTFDATSLTFEDYAIEDCPNLKEIHISKDATYGEDAFYGISPDCRIIKY